MRKTTTTLLFGLLLASLLSACSGPKAAAQRVPRETMVQRCTASAQARVAAVADGSHQPFALFPEDDVATATWTEQQSVDAVLGAKPGAETWVIARGGVGKSRLSSSLEALTCARQLTFHVDVGLDLRAALDAAVPGQPAIARVLLGQLGVHPGDDPAEQLHDELGDLPWLLLIDGTDDLTQSERRKLNAELDWLKGANFRQHIVRFERPGMVGVKPEQPTGLVLRLPDLTCAEADGVIERRFPDPASLQRVRTWLTAHQLDRKRRGGPCRYVHMSTHRDAETLADLAKDAFAPPASGEQFDDTPTDPVRAEIYTTWLAHRLHALASTRDAALIWLDQITTQGVHDRREPDLRLTLRRCELAPTPGGVEASGVCKRLMQSPVVRRNEAGDVATLAHLTLMDLLLARWLVRGQTDCALLTSAAADTGSLEVAMMVASLPTGRQCLTPMVAAVCSRGIPVDDIIGFVDEAVPMAVREEAFFEAARAGADGPCEQRVFKGLQHR